MPHVGDRWVYEARDANRPEKKYEIVVEVQAVTSSSVRDVFKPEGGAAVVLTHRAGATLVGVAPGIASFSPYLRAFQEFREGERWPHVEYKQLWNCSANVYCSVTASIVGKERVSVRAGTFDAWKIVVIISYFSGHIELGYWYSEDPKRVVKYQIRAISPGMMGALWIQPDIDMELVSYVPAGTK